MYSHVPISRGVIAGGGTTFLETLGFSFMGVARGGIPPHHHRPPPVGGVPSKSTEIPSIFFLKEGNFHLKTNNFSLKEV